MTVFDVGANVGFLSVILARLVGPGGKVVSLEPLPANAEMIERNARNNGFSQLSVRREAAGAADGPARFLVARETVSSKLASVAQANDPFVGEVEVSVRRLDSVCDGPEGLPPRLPQDRVPKGQEADVLMYAAATLNSAPPPSPDRIPRH